MEQASQDNMFTMASNQLQKVLSLKRINPENIRKKSTPETTISPPVAESNMTFLVFVNPKSGGQDGPQLLDKFRKLFQEVSLASRFSLS